jgi:hypothetical protein
MSPFSPSERLLLHNALPNWNDYVIIHHANKCFCSSFTLMRFASPGAPGTCLNQWQFPYQRKNVVARQSPHRVENRRRHLHATPLIWDSGTHSLQALTSRPALVVELGLQACGGVTVLLKQISLWSARVRVRFLGEMNWTSWFNLLEKCFHTKLLRT